MCYISSVLTLAALADPVRREIVEMLSAGEAEAGAIARRFPVSRPAISRHLRVLREAALVRVEAQGRRRVYTLNRAALAELRGWLERLEATQLTGPAGRLDALDTELHRGRRARRAADLGGTDARINTG